MSAPTDAAADILDAAADVLDERGWNRGGFTANPDGSGGCCVMGAIAIADPDTHLYLGGDDGAAAVSFSTAASLARYDLERELGIDEQNVRLWEWNDAQRDKRVVQRALRRTARKLREGAAS